MRRKNYSSGTVFLGAMAMFGIMGTAQADKKPTDNIKVSGNTVTLTCTSWPGDDPTGSKPFRPSDEPRACPDGRTSFMCVAYPDASIFAGTVQTNGCQIIKKKGYLEKRQIIFTYSCPVTLLRNIGPNQCG